MFSFKYDPLKTANYRSDIDGLRALAVIAVVLFHAFPHHFPGGFIGVDIFFVISGYLITRIIIHQIQSNKFSFYDFYSRRILRIFPALLVVLFTCAFLGWFVLLADEYKYLGRHIKGGVGFFSNILLRKEGGYFDAAPNTKLLLHLWSLAIEEQFYLIWPFLLVIAYRLHCKFRYLFLVVLVSSFIWNVWSIQNSQIDAFYSPLARFWEFMFGALLVFPTINQRSDKGTLGAGTFNKGWIAAVISLLGISLLLGGIFLLNERLTWPGWWALIPTFGASCLLFSGSSGLVNRLLLSNQVLVFLGLISYPLYLWHWPIFTVLNIVDGGERPTYDIYLLAIGISLVLAWLTYRLIELPLRVKGVYSIKTYLLVGAAFLIGVAAYLIDGNNGYESRESSIMRLMHDGDIGHDAFHQYPYKKFYPCTPDEIFSNADRWNDSVRCFQSKEGAPTIALLGDSHAEMLFIGLAEALPNKNIVFYIKSGPPLLSNNNFDRIFEFLKKDKNISTVIVNSFWEFQRSRVSKNSSLEKEIDAVLKLLLQSGKKIYLVENTPYFGFDAKKCKFDRRFGRHACTQYIDLNKSNEYTLILQDEIRKNPDIQLLKTVKYFCENEFCKMEKGEIFFRDWNHLNIRGSIYLGKKLIEDNPSLSQM